MKLRYLSILIPLTALAVLLAGCGNNTRKPEFKKSPVDEIIKDLNDKQNFSIILYDMDFEEKEEIYKHKYEVIVVENNTPETSSAVPQDDNLDDFQEVPAAGDSEPADTAYSEITDWKQVSPEFFNKHIDNMGMEIVSKIDGKVEKVPAPPGYSNYIGNEKYGQWKNDNSGNRFWEFYGKYAFMTSMFHLAMMPARYSMWNNYHSIYRPYGRPYYGNVGNGRAYGTGSAFNSRAMANTSYEKKPASFKQRVRDRVSRSKSTQTNTRKTTRTSNSRVRSRSVGTGK